MNYEREEYHRANEQMLAQGVLVSVPPWHSESEDEFEPEPIPGQPVSEIILEEQR